MKLYQPMILSKMKLEKMKLAMFLTFLTLFTVGMFSTANQASANAIKQTFSKFDEKSDIKVDNSLWNKILKAHITKGENDLNLFNYKALKENNREDLTNYLKILESTDVTKLNRNEQFAFWANLYNAKTIDVILDHYPTKSIRDIDISPGIFSNGPWGKKLVTINGIELSLDDIEHKIMRVLWKEPRVHYAVNCASIGCPNLATEALTGENLEIQLNKGAVAYVNSPRGVKVENGNVTVSKIYNWFKEDFGSSQANILKHVRKYASPELKEKLKGKTKIYDYEYDWSLNETKG